MKEPSLGAIFEILKTIDNRLLELHNRLSVLEKITAHKLIEKKKRMKMKEIIMDNTVKFVRLRQDWAIYSIIVKKITYQFPIPLDDLEGATLEAQHKAITLMRYIRLAIKNDTFIKV